jgi:hypothetical protein
MVHLPPEPLLQVKDTWKKGPTKMGVRKEVISPLDFTLFLFKVRKTVGVHFWSRMVIGNGSISRMKYISPPGCPK